MAPLSRPSGQRFVVMFFLGSLAFLTYFDRVCITRAESDIRSDLRIDEFQMGIIMGAFWLAYALFELPTGWMGDRYGARITIARIVIAWSLMTALSGAAWSFLALLSFRFLFGVGEAGAFPNMARVQSRWLPVHTRGRMSGLLWMMARWGAAASPLIFGAMMTTFDSPEFRSLIRTIPGAGTMLSELPAWRFGFFASGLVGVVWVIVFYWWFRDHPSENRMVNTAELALISRGAPPEVLGHSMPARLWLALFTSRSLLALGTFYFFASFGWSFFVSWMPKYYKDVLGVSYGDSEWMSAAPFLFMGLACIVGGSLSQALIARTGWRWLGRAAFPISGLIAAATCMYLIQHVRTPWQAASILCIAAFTFDFGQAANWATIVDIGGKYAGVAAGLINLIGCLGNAFQPAVGALIRENFGWNALFFVYGACFLIAAAMWLLVDPRRTFYDHLERQSSPAAG